MHRYVILGMVALLSLGSLLLAADRKRLRKRDQIRQCAVCQPEAPAPLADQQRDRQQDQQRDQDCTCDNFVDADGDGVCDNCDGACNPDAPDDDGDGIPNGQDDDYSPPEDGTGNQRGRD
jgi:hypothetical protein